MISPEGTFPPLGRSLAYRCGVFQLLAQLAWLDQLPPSLSAAQVRCGLTAVMRRMLEAEGTFTADGWLTIGFCGHQPGKQSLTELNEHRGARGSGLERQARFLLSVNIHLGHCPGICCNIETLHIAVEK
ncbi:DUF2264 domain-containing protein [Paenibacillus thiaminolyticus]|uniref:DUF2264 domain-containing protein n=1 Tax=Paenibacillus thiaminolyticus TaxID=49283 RepID=UPI0035A70DDA